MRIILFLISIIMLLNTNLWAQVPNLIPYSNGKLWGYMRYSSKSIVIKAQFDHADFFRSGRAVMVKNDKVGLIDTLGNYAIPPKYDIIRACNHSPNYIVKQGEYYGIVDKKDSIIFHSTGHEHFNLNPQPLLHLEKGSVK